MSCSLTCGVSFSSSATFSRCTLGKKLDTPAKPGIGAAPPGAAPPPSPNVLTGNGTREPTEISPSSLFMIRRCGFDSTSTSLFVCSALISTPNDGMSRVAVDPAPRLRASSGDSTGPSTPASIVSVSAPAGNNVLAGLRPPTAEALVVEPGDVERLRAVERHAEVALLVERDLEDHRLDEHLLARRIQPLDHAAHRLVVLQRRDDDQRVGRPIEVDPDVAFEQQVLDALLLAAAGRRRRRRRRGLAAARSGPAAGAARADVDGHAGDRAQRLRQLVAVRVLAVVDVDAAVALAAADLAIELIDHPLHALVRPLRGDHDQLVRAFVRDDLRDDHLRGQITDLRLRAPRRRAAPRPPFFTACCTWKISPSFCAISVAPVCLRLMIQTFSFAPG